MNKNINNNIGSYLNINEDQVVTLANGLLESTQYFNGTVSSSSSSSSSTNGSISNSIPGILDKDHDQFLNGINSKKECPFCFKTFNHPGSLGRHLDLKKGTNLHPIDIITKLRSNVKRRGDIVKIKERRKLRSKRYNSQKFVKERLKLQRQIRDKFNRAKRISLNKFIEQKLNKPKLQPHPSFPRIVLYFLKSNQWPHDPPTLETYRLLCSTLKSKLIIDENNNEEKEKIYNDLLIKIDIASNNWLKLSESSKFEIWNRELRKAAEESLSNISLYELNKRDEMIEIDAKALVDDDNDDDDDNDNDNDNDDDNDDDNESEINSVNDIKDDNVEFYNHNNFAIVAQAAAVINNDDNNNNNNNNNIGK
ncbi:hypothetical protein WICMUC_005561 [Wickerhamomyces mucosus]|uniref:C2H2-type domain-containing protein n=1 Tax=Wickerhamomyces mucosus TaxID=1378264 RepID=A0A9P8T5S4_9ASCO|nr:hypothetical protein WICMUC_005561 [Wickerhamomyces mucosus]